MVGVRGVTGGLVPGRPRAPRSGGGGFSLSAARTEVPVAAPAAAAQATSLLALQEGLAAEERDARARKQANAALQQLSELQLALLAGRADPARLEALARTLPTPEEAADPGLAAAIAAIRLRMRVELARHGVVPPASHD